MKSNIDCVILWVDGSDPEWIKTKNEYLPENKKIEYDSTSNRFRDLDILKYLFRGLEVNADWFRYIFFITCGQRPKWLNLNHPKLKIVDHKDFIPANYLPTFSSHTIEMNLHRIEELSEQFVYFNDDMFILQKTSPDVFFHDGLPCDSAIMNAFAISKSESEFRFLMPVNNIEIINAHFNKQKVLNAYFTKFYNLKYGSSLLRTLCLTPWRHFTGFTINHMPYSLKKSVLQEIWEKEPIVLDRTCSHRFRNSNDINIWLACNWQFVTGQFYPRNPKYGYLCNLTNDDENNRQIFQHVINQKTKLICINDDVSDENALKVKKQISKAFERVYPHKSSFEI